MGVGGVVVFTLYNSIVYTNITNTISLLKADIRESGVADVVKASALVVQIVPAGV